MIRISKADMVDLKRVLDEDAFAQLDAARTSSSITAAKLTHVIEVLRIAGKSHDARGRTALMLWLKLTRKVEADSNRKENASD